MLTVVAEYSRECPAIHVGRKLKSADVLAVPTDRFIPHGPPAHIRSENGAEFTAIAVRDWLGWVGVKTERLPYATLRSANQGGHNRRTLT